MRDLRAALEGPSRTIVVEPIKAPSKAPKEAPSKAPAKEPVKV